MCPLQKETADLRLIFSVQLLDSLLAVPVCIYLEEGNKCCSGLGPRVRSCLRTWLKSFTNS